jgi:hypothetical protein
VYVANTNAIISSGGGNVSVTGQGGGSGTSDSNYGVIVFIGTSPNVATITSGGDGTVTVIGTGGNASGSGGSQHGVYVDAAKITSGGNGLVTVQGTGSANSGNSNSGVVVVNTNAIITSGGGNVSITGQGGGSGTSTTNHGVYVLSVGQITAGGSGTITVSGTGGASTGDNNHGVYVSGTSALITSSSGSITVTGTKGSSTNATVADILLETDGIITSTSTTAGIILNATSAGLFANTTGNDISTDASQSLTLGAANLNFDLDNTTVDTEYQQLNLIGQIDLNNAGLSFYGSDYTPVEGDVFVLINNDGTDAIVGTFSGFAEGDEITNFLGSTLSAMITYQGGDDNDVVLNIINPLPVTLVSFTSSCQENNTLLKWTTASEYDNDYFGIEKSTDGFEWQTISNVKGAGNSELMQNYAFTDSKNYQGVVYYRLKQTNFDGTFEYSEVISSTCEHSEVEITLSPNPTRGKIRILHLKESVKIVVVSLQGQIIMEREGQEPEMDLDLSTIPQGMYFVKIDDGKKQITKKLAVYQ